jgi:hypothetical protein
VSVCELFAWQPPSETYPNTLMLQKVIELVDDGYKMRFRHIQVFFTGIRANKFSILYVVNKRHDITEHTNQPL